MGLSLIKILVLTALVCSVDDFELRITCSLSKLEILLVCD